MQNNVVAIKNYEKPVDQPRNVAAEYWKLIIGTKLTPQAESLLTYWRGHVSDEDLFFAIDETALAPQPSIRYTIAILRRIAAEKGASR